MTYLPKLPVDKSNPSINKFCTLLANKGFCGDILPDFDICLLYATDNSIYQQQPQLVLYPKNKQDIVCLLKLITHKEFKHLHICARGGGTGTNGQSLTDGIVVDFSRYMTSIIEINTSEKYAIVEPGVILTELNQNLKKHGYFFAPDVSTASRATIGGMIANDSSGKGSRIYGKTSDHIIELEQVLLSGDIINTKADTKENTHKSLHELYDYIDYFGNKHKNLIAEKYPDIDRGLTGYNLSKVCTKINGESALNLNYIFSGAEGSLSLITKAKLKITKLPACKKLVVISYPDFKSALLQAPILLQSKVIAVETLDDTVANLSKNTLEWQDVSHILSAGLQSKTGTFNLLEFQGDTQQDIDKDIAKLNNSIIDSNLHSDIYITSKANEIKSLWAIRSKSVGLLGNYNKTKGLLRPKPIAFIEDTAVNPSVLADYIMDLRKLLDGHSLDYGMFGHIDAGCLHVRPAIDMTSAKERKKIRLISDQVMTLVKKYKGVFWGEHGKGYRAEFSEQHFGTRIYNALKRIKLLLDANNQLNRGKIIVADNKNNISLLAIDKIPTRGEKDSKIPRSVRKDFTKALECNGNTLCYNINSSEAMCPSYKASLNRLHSPKGRATMLREWLRMLANKSVDPKDIKFNPLRWFKKAPKNDFSLKVYDTFKDCLSCKACTATCPVNVDIPTLRANFLQHYHKNYARPFKDYFIGLIEYFAPLMAFMPRISNWLLRFSPMIWLMKKIGLVNMPLISNSRLASLGNKAYYSSKLIQSMSQQKRKKVIVIIQDAFTSYFDAESVRATYLLLQELGYTPLIHPFFINGKAKYVKGFLGSFKKIVTKNNKLFEELHSYNLTSIGIEPSMTMVYRDEYKQFDAHPYSKNIKTLPEWLSQEIKNRNCKIVKTRTINVQHQLLLHCTESTNIAKISSDWIDIFKFFNIDLIVKNTGCCGMAGTYGHELENQTNSKNIFNLSWKSAFSNIDGKQILATGFSCRSQTKIMLGIRPEYPAEALLRVIK